MIEAVNLTGQQVRLEPLTQAHADGLRRAVCDGELWKLFYTQVPAPDAVADYIATAESLQQRGEALAFATIDIASGKVVGSSRLCRYQAKQQRLELGYTFIAQSFQRTAINTEAKLLMLSHAFETLSVNRVEFITDHFNQASQRAILRLGATHEGRLRNHMVMPNGRIRDSIVFSIIKPEWPGVKQHLNFKLARLN